MSWYDIFKDVAKVAQKADNLDLCRKLLDAQAEAMKLVEENAALKERVQSLEEKLAFKGNLVRWKDAYWEADESGNRVGDPICSACWDSEGKVIHLVVANSSKEKCPICNTMVWTDDSERRGLAGACAPIVVSQRRESNRFYPRG